MNEKANETNQSRTILLADIRATFATPAGARTLAFLTASTGLGKPAFLPTPTGIICPYAAAFRDGRHSVLYEINALLAEPEDAQPQAPKIIRATGRKKQPQA